MRAGTAALLLAVASGVAFGLHTISDPDVHQQIAVGRAILADPSSIGTSTFTHTFPGFRYVEDKWLASVIVALVDRAGGTDALMLYQIGLAALAAAAWFVLLRVWGVAPWGALAGTSVLLAACAFRLEPRPDTASHALLAIVLALLGSEVPLRRVAPWLVALMVVWVNLHGYFVNGLLAIAAAAVAAALGDPRGPLAAAEPLRAIRRGALLLGAAAAACVVHPQGVSAAIWPIRQILILRAEPALRTALTEFAPSTDLLAGMGVWRAMILLGAPAAGIALAAVRAGADARIRILAGAALAGAWIAAPAPGSIPWPYRVTFALWIAASVEAPRAARERRVFPVLVFAGFSVLAAPMVRNLSLVPPAAAIVLAPAWVEASRRWRTVPAARLRGAAIAVCVAAAVWGRLADHLAPGTYRAPGWTGWGLARDRFPEKAAEMLAGGALPGELLDNYDTSGYLLYRIHPARAAFIVDNTSMYPVGFLEEYRTKIMAGRVDPEEIHARWNVSTAVVDHAAFETPGLVGRLSRSPTWKLVHLDRACAVWLRGDGAPAVDIDAVAARLAAQPLDRSPLPAWLAPRRRLFPALNLGIFLRAAGRPDLALREADRLWADGPSIEVATFTAAASEEAGRLAEAVSRLATARDVLGGSKALDGWLARALFVRGVLRLDRGDAPGARDDLERALALAPESGGSALALARVEASVGRSERARFWLTRALDSGDGARLREAALRDPLLAPLLRQDSGSVP